MGTWDVRLIGADYDLNNTNIRLYGKTRDGQAITIVKKDFWPYFYACTHVHDAEEILGEDGDVRRVESRQLLVSGDDITCAKITVTKPFTVPRYRKKFQDAGYAILAADIPFHHRFLYDNDIGACVSVKASPTPCRSGSAPSRTRRSTSTA